MRRRPGSRVLAAVAALAAFPLEPARAINGVDLALRSFGAVGATPTDWNLTENGYVGTYVTLAAPGEVTIAVSASGQSGGGADSRMNVVIGDQSAPFDVTAGFNSYMHTFALPAGTHFVRTEYTNDFVSNSIPAANRQLTVRSLNVAGAIEANANTDALALAAADDYIQHGRRGPARVQLYGATPGTSVEVKLKRHAFNFGTNIYGTGNTALKPLTIPEYAQFVRDHFNMIVPSRAGKWNNNEPTRDQSIIYTVPGVPASGYLDSMLDFAQANNMRARMHNLIWGNDATNEEQPAWAVSLLTGGTPANLSDLRTEISERIDDYVGGAPVGGVDLADRYSEVDIYNESIHTGVNTPGSSVNYWDRYLALGISGIYQEAADAALATGSNAKMYVNEYNILQNGFDDYGNWFRQHIEQIQNADGNPNGPVSGIGMQLYVVNGHTSSYMQQVLQNMSVSGLPLSVTEFGVQDDDATPAPDISPDDAAAYAKDSLRMMFGSPDATTFMWWGFWTGNAATGGVGSATSDLQRASVMVDQNWNLTPAGKMYEDLLGIHDWDNNPNNAWTTNETLTVGPDGAIDFTGFFGDYDVKIGSTTYAMNLAKGAEDYSLIVGLPSADFDFDGDQDGSDFLAWQRGFGTTSSAEFALGDANYDREIDDDDLALWMAQFGEAAVPATDAVPEPTSTGLAAVGLIALTRMSRLAGRRLRPGSRR